MRPRKYNLATNKECEVHHAPLFCPACVLALMSYTGPRRARRKGTAHLLPTNGRSFEEDHLALKKYLIKFRAKLKLLLKKIA